MYSPKISEELIPLLYRLAKAKAMPMTRLVNGLLSAALDSQREQEPCPVVERQTS